MGMREKLIELLTAPISITESVLGEEATPKMQMGRIFAENLADHLIANGVTIPVLCKDCKHFIKEEHGCDHHGYFFPVHVVENDFCSYGERRTDDA
jgi:hypothetical protein